MNRWIDHAVWWHVYPLGFVGAELTHDDPFLLRRTDAVDLDQVEHHAQHAGTFDVARGLLAAAGA